MVRDFKNGRMGRGLKYEHIRSASKWPAFVVGILLASVNANADEFRFGEWRGEFDLAGSSPISISANDFGEESTSSLQLTCTPRGWSGAPEGSPTPVFQGLLMDLSSGISVEVKKESCVIQARGVTHGGEERIVRSEALCERSVVDASDVDKWSEILDLLSTVVLRSGSAQTEGEKPRITVYRHDGSEFTFVAPTGANTSRALSWMTNACKRLRKSDGRVSVPGPTYGVWFTRYSYDEFHERILPASIKAQANDGNNEVSIGCDGQVTAFHRTDDCQANVRAGDIESCRIYARIDGSPAIEEQALCRSLCFVEADYRNDGEIVSAMQVGERARIRVSGPYDAHRRDFALSLWGFKSAHHWVVSKCASLSEVE